MSGRHRILVVDDDSLNLAIMQEILGEEYDLVLATTGEECLELAQVAPPALVLLDIMLPGIDGYETCRRLREDPLLRYAKVVLVSAKVHLEERLKGYESEADDYITKPFDSEELLAKVRVLLRLRYAEEMEQFKGQFLDLLAHETRTPLTGILSPAQFLQDSDELPRDQRAELTGIIIENAKSLFRLVQGTADLCAFKAGRATLEQQALDLTGLVESLARVLQPLATEKSMQMEVHASSHPQVMGDAEKLNVAFHTLLENAIVHGKEGSLVEVRISECSLGVEVQFENQGDVVPEEQMPYVFEAFQVHDVDHYSKGVGVDLALAREIARAHDGDLDCRFGSMQSMVFRMVLPIHEEASETLTQDPALLQTITR